MRTGVIYTGEIRTFEKTVSFLQKNVLLHPDVHIFAVLQSDDIPKHEVLIRESLGEHLKSLIWLDKNDMLWLQLRDTLLNNMLAQDWVKNYLRNGGSMIEYYQMYLAYQELCKYEENNEKYEYIIRCRTDTLFNKPIDFSWLNLSEDNYNNRLSLLKEFSSNVRQQLSYFMSTLINDDLIKNLNSQIDIYESCEFPTESYYLSFIDEYLRNYLEFPTYENILKYIQNGNYILTIRKNLLYIVKRNLFFPITNLYNSYGQHNFFMNPHWWNAESQFRSICAENGLSIFNYDSVYENKSISSYKTEDYFNSDGELINKDILYLLVRY